MHVILFVARQVRSIGQDHRKLFSIWSLMLTYLLNHVAANYVAILPSGRGGFPLKKHENFESTPTVLKLIW